MLQYRRRFVLCNNEAHRIDLDSAGRSDANNMFQTSFCAGAAHKNP